MFGGSLVFDASLERYPCIVMELLELDLAKVLWPANGVCTLDDGKKVSIGAQLADACAYLGVRMIVHGDMKPENILMTPDMRPKLCDFGFAREVQHSLRVMSSSLSSLGGTAAYMVCQSLC
jgi:serine/threonine protein kinase